MRFRFSSLVCILSTLAHNPSTNIQPSTVESARPISWHCEILRREVQWSVQPVQLTLGIALRSTLNSHGMLKEFHWPFDILTTNTFGQFSGLHMFVFS